MTDNYCTECREPVRIVYGLPYGRDDDSRQCYVDYPDMIRCCGHCEWCREYDGHRLPFHTV